MSHDRRKLLVVVAAIQTCFAQTQPIPFSHKTHVADVKLDCEYCHSLPEKFGDAVGIPDAPKCLECHAYSTNATPTRETLQGFAEKKQAIPWVRIFSLKGFVVFDHRFHLQNGATCESCHGPISTEDVVSDKQSTTKMETCQGCHVKSGALTGCTTCHNPR
jgi:hypothetical protein